MRVKPDTFAMTLILAAMTALGPLSIDMYLPSLPSIGESLRASPSLVQLTLSGYMFGFAAGQILYGPISDKFGRKPALLVGYSIYLVATIACILAHSIEIFIAARVLQAIGASGPITIARAMVRDLYEGPRAGREMALMGSIMGLAPVIAPTIGGFLDTAFGWRSTFVLILTLAIVLTVLAVFLLPETLRRRQAGPLSLTKIIGSFRFVLRNRAYRVYAGLMTLSFCGIFCFLSMSSYILQDVYGLGEIAYALAFGSCACCGIVGNLATTRLLPTRGIDGVISIGVFLLAVGGLSQFAGVLLMPTNPLGIIIPQMMYSGGMGITMSLSLAAAMQPFPERAGAASSLSGLFQMTSGAIVGIVISNFIGGSALPLVIALSTMGLACFLLFHLTARIRRPLDVLVPEHDRSPVSSK